MPSFLETAERAARAGGNVLREWQEKSSNQLGIHEKSPSDWVTEADLASQRAVFDIISAAYPDHELVGEEDFENLAAGNRTAIAAASERCRWFVDPLDGTANFVHRMPFYCVSIAMERAGRVEVGVIYDPVRDQMFSAARGQGAYLNGERLRCSQTESLSYALVAVGLASRVEKNSFEAQWLQEILSRCQSIRRIGSAALCLAYVAAGWFDAYWAQSVKAWDVAAGSLLVEEAGGAVSSANGGEFCSAQATILAANGAAIHREIMNVTREAAE